MEKVHAFTAGLDRQEFYDFYGLMTALASPACGDYVLVNGKMLNLKKMVRRLRITMMYPRFAVDYAEPYTVAEARADYDALMAAYQNIARVDEKQAVAKVAGALKALVEAMPSG